MKPTLLTLLNYFLSHWLRHLRFKICTFLKNRRTIPQLSVNLQVQNLRFMHKLPRATTLRTLLLILMFSSLHINNLFLKILIGMGNIQIHFIGIFYVFRLLKRYYDNMRRFQHFKTLFWIEVYLTCKFVTLEENIRQKL